jgi:site-specific DNA-cytosine methylase
MKNKIKESRKKMQRPEVESVLGGGRKNISPFDIIPYLPDEDCFFDSRHWVYGTDVLPFALTTRIAANNQQYLKETNMADQNAIELPSELKGKKFRIRKLTPRECFRLMGVDDKDIDKIQAAGVSNSAQYKLAGNSIVVDVLFHIFRKMFIETDNESQQLTLF